MRKAFVLFLALLFFASSAFAGILLYEPKDKLVTFDKVYMLNGVGKDIEVLKVNEIPLKVKADGSFSCGLVLKRGKNYVEVRALDKEKEHYIKQIRALSLKTFPDIEKLYDGKRHWARNQVVYLSTLGFIEGYPDDNFYPSLPATRGELATWVARIRRLGLEALTQDVFMDVPKEHWRAPYVKAVVDAGFMARYDEDTFGIDDPISRREAAEIVVLSEGADVIERVKPLFLDVPEEEAGSSPIYTARERGLVRGVSEDIAIFDPDRALTRAEAAVLLSRFTLSFESIRDLFDFGSGYSKDIYCRLNVAPEIPSFTTEPKSIQANIKNVVKLRAEIASREGFTPISKVKVDLSEINGLPDTEMFDDATHGDVEKGDRIYSLNLSLEPKSSGNKTLRLTVIDRLGWEAERETSLLIVE